ncbi:hypothetical protein AAG570_011583 [Ranatra chinensis]|uniref:Uncharacterized protein n=1 Tax=Ranatra chinensis TaxID=642074 RepID=A0ABD0YL66_9HEMI
MQHALGRMTGIALGQDQMHGEAVHLILEHKGWKANTDVNRSWRIDDSSVGPSVRVAVTPRPAAKANGGGGRSSSGRSSGGRSSSGNKIPRPPNAFMLYANTWRRRLAYAHPGESNKEISVSFYYKRKEIQQIDQPTKEGKTGLYAEPGVLKRFKRCLVVRQT